MRNKALLLCIVWLLLISCSPLKDYNVKDRKWAFPEIEAFERLDKTQSYAEDAILFIGSSSIRLWKTLIEDMKPYSVIQRGYGGAHFRDMVFFTDLPKTVNHPLILIQFFFLNKASLNEAIFL
ncbi:hypothetical protein PQZ08_05095 [Flavobacteriaceae bacterium]|nr:hypothetical protein [Flavobacteriaceae bacterium]